MEPWTGRVATIVERGAALLPAGGGDRAKVGRLRPVGEGGWLRLEGRAGPSLVDRVDEAVIAPAGGPEVASFAVAGAEVRDGALLVRTATTLTRPDLDLYAPPMHARRILEALAERLRALQGGPLVERLEQRRLDPIIHGAEPPPDRFSAEQVAALDACTSPGLQVVWGPPGTGKTHVIARALRRSIARGHRVLLVSSTNVAVDNAVERAAGLLAEDGMAEPGTIVRVGVAHLTSVAGDERVALRALVDRRVSHHVAESKRLAGVVDELGRSEAAASSTVKDDILALRGFDPDRYAAALARRRARDALAAANRVVDAARPALADAEAALGGAQRARLLAQFECEVLRERERRAALRTLTEALARLDAASGLQRMRSRRARWEASVARQDAIAEVERASEARRACQRALGSDTPEVRAPDVDSPAFVDADVRAQVQLVAAREAVEGAETEVARARQRLASAHAEAAHLEAEPSPSHEDLVLIDDAERRNLPGLLARRTDLLRAVADARERRLVAEAQLERHEADGRQARQAAERSVIAEARVVATTLTMLAVKPQLADERFDIVIVDEAAAASLPHVVHAVGRARVGACLVGDYFQNGPITEMAIGSRKGDRELVDHFTRDCFAQVGLTTTEEARNGPGCAVLTEQWRFGTVPAELANRSCYGGLLRTPRGAPATEIVVIDVDGLPESLAIVRRASGSKVTGSWLGGALITRALCEHHLDGGTEIGVITPYKPQAQATSTVLEDIEGGEAIEVGTSHAFQGREFDVVIFDTVEAADLREGGWVMRAAAGSGPWALEGLRLTNVAMTRARRRAYVIVNRVALQRARRGPLRHLADLVEDGRVEVVKAGEVLGDVAGTSPEGSPLHDEVRDVLGRYVRIAGLYDQVTTPGAVEERIASATESVWAWSPWIGLHATALQDALVDAQARGVDVHLVALPPGHDLTAKNEGALAALRRRLDRVTHVHRMHEKLVVVDRRWTFIGSMNTLSHAARVAQRKSEVVVQIDGRRFAEQLLLFERAEQLARAPMCSRCRTALDEVRRYEAPERNWYWVCRRGRSGARCTTKVAFTTPDDVLGWRTMPGP